MSDELLVPVNGFRFMPLGCVVAGQPDFAAWSVALNQVEHVHRCAGWWLGDLLNYGEAAYGERYTQAVQATGLAVQTLMEYKSLAKRIPLEQRIEGVSYSVHREIANAPAARRETLRAWIGGRLAAGDTPTVREVRWALVNGYEAPMPAEDGLEMVVVRLTGPEAHAILAAIGEGEVWESARQKVEAALLRL